MIAKTWTDRTACLPGLLALLLGTSAACGDRRTSEASRPPRSAEQIALQAVRDRLGTPTAEVQVVATGRAVFPELQRTIAEFKIRDAAGALHSIALDDALQPVAVAQFVERERAARTARIGALDEALATRLDQVPDASQQVIVWIVDRSRVRDSRPPSHGEPLRPAQIDATYKGVEDARGTALAGQIAPILERLRRVDPAARADSSSPAVTMTAGAEALRALARDPDIERIYLRLRGAPETGEAAKATTGISGLQAGGAKGGGVRVALTEAEGRVEPASLLLNTIVQDAANVCPTPSDHTTEVASIIKGRRVSVFGATTGVEGAAPQVMLRVGGSCATDSTELMDASSRAALWGARVISMSWGLDTQLMTGGVDRFYDDMTFNRWRTVVKSAGNRACMTPGNEASGPGSGLTTTPGLGFNVITVGGFDDHDTPAWADDSIYVCSSFANPISTHGDREKPELSAPAVNLTVTTLGPANLTTVSGTSGASPLVAASAALMIERNGRLSFWPEITRAILMATAIHNIEGSSRLSDVDGAGGLNAGDAVSVAGDPQRTGGLWYTCDGSTPMQLPLATLSVGPRTRQRVVISWDTDPTSSNYPSQPSADIDLEIVDPQGRVVAASRSFDGTNEIVDFNTFLAATLTLRAVKFRCELPTWLGWAWQTTPVNRLPR